MKKNFYFHERYIIRVYEHILACLDSVWARNLTVFSDDASFFFKADFQTILKLTLKLVDNFLSTVFLDTKNKFEHAPLFLVSSLGEKIQVAKIIKAI